MKPILFMSNEAAFDTNGIGILGDCGTGRVMEERNGMYELEMEYPIFGVHYKDIALRSLIAAKPNPTTVPQPFRVYDISRPMNGMVTIYGRHICYDLDGIPVSPFKASSAPQAMQRLKANAATDCPFEFWTDKSTAANMTVSVPSEIWSLLGGSEGGVLDVYGGEYEFDRFTVKLHGQRGFDRGVTIRYGKNLTDLQQEESCAAMYTGVYPYWADAEGDLVTLPEKTIQAPGTYNFTRIMPLDLSTEWEERPTVAQLRSRSQSYVTDNNIGVPKVSLTVSFAQLEQTEEYKTMALLERVSLCDTVSVEFSDMNVSAKAKVVKTTYDFINERYESVELGDARTNLADTIVAQGQAIQKKPSETAVMSAIISLTAAIIGAKGGAVRLLDTDKDGWPDELYVADNPDPAKAVKVWRFNYEGLAASKNGYNGPFVLGMSLEHGILADFITSGKIKTELLDVASIFAEHIVATGDIEFKNNRYQIVSDTEAGKVTIRSWNDLWLEGEFETGIYARVGGINMSCQTTIRMAPQYQVVIETRDVIINGKKLVFSSDGTVKWEAT